MLKVSGSRDAPGEVVNQLRLGDDRLVADEQPVGVDVVVRTRKVTSERARTLVWLDDGPVRALEAMRPSAFDNTIDTTPCQLFDMRLVSMKVTPL